MKSTAKPKLCLPTSLFPKYVKINVIICKNLINKLAYIKLHGNILKIIKEKKYMLKKIRN